jgi:hypothetical protein
MRSRLAEDSYYLAYIPKTKAAIIVHATDIKPDTNIVEGPATYEEMVNKLHDIRDKIDERRADWAWLDLIRARLRGE